MKYSPRVIVITLPGSWPIFTNQVRSGQVYLILLKPKSETMRVVNKAAARGYLRGIDGFKFESSYARIDRCGTVLTAFQITNCAMKPVIRKACPRAGRCNFGAAAHARAAFAS